MIFKLIALAEGAIIFILIAIIIQKAKFDMEMEDYEDFTAVVHSKFYSDNTITFLYSFGSITIKDKDLYNGFYNGDKVTLRLKVIRNSKGDIVKISKKNPIVLKSNVG